MWTFNIEMSTFNAPILIKKVSFFKLTMKDYFKDYF